MKIILSRKGIDSGALSGKMASPILPCGCLCSIPIPYRCGIAYSAIRFGTRPVERIVKELNRSWANNIAHLDPDLRHDALPKRPKGWRPAFGQSGAAAGHLINQKVDRDDLFIFFGWFRRTVVEQGELRFDPSDIHGRHIVYGWLQVGEVVKHLPLSRRLMFLQHHPHVQFFTEEVSPNRIYVSSQSGLKAGIFSTEREALILTRNGGRRSRWLLPEAFESLFLERDLSYHGRETRWEKDGTEISLQTVSRGQEFVLDGTRHPKVVSYFVNRIKGAPTGSYNCAHSY